MRSSFFSALIVIFAFGFARGTFAEEVIFNLSGHITSVSGVTEISDESTFTGTITYDSDAPVLQTLIYQGTSLTILIDGSYSVQTQQPDVSVMNDAELFGWYYDQFKVESHAGNEITNPFSGSMLSFRIDLVGAYQSSGQGPLTSTDLPLTIDISGFNYPMSGLFIGDGNNITIQGVVDAIERYIPDDDSDGITNSLDTCPNTPEGLPVKPNGCVEGDYDNDNDVDGDDLANFSECFGL